MKKVILMIFICISIFKLNAAKKVDLGVGLKSNISITRSFVIKQRENIIQDETIKLSYNMVGLVCPIYFNLLERNKLSFGLLYNLPGISFNLNKSFDLEEKSESTYNKYFKTFKESWGAEFKNNNLAKELYNDIINMNKDLPEDLLLFYKCFKQIVDTLVIK